MPNKVLTTMVQSYLPEIDATEELEPDDIQFFQELLGIVIGVTFLTARPLFPFAYG